LAVAQKVAGKVLRQDDEIALHMVVGDTTGVRSPASGADGGANFGETV